MMGDASTVEALVLGPVEIVAMRRRHLRGVVRIDQQTNHRPWSHRLFAGELDLGDQRYYLVALDRSVVVGYGGLMLTGFEAHLTTLAVDPVHHRQGIGARLMAQICAGAIERGVDDITLEVRMTNRGAQELYRRFGFVPGGVRPGYYADVGEDALIMWAHDLASEGYAERLAGIRTGLGTA